MPNLGYLGNIKFMVYLKKKQSRYYIKTLQLTGSVHIATSLKSTTYSNAAKYKPTQIFQWSPKPFEMFVTHLSSHRLQSSGGKFVGGVSQMNTCGKRTDREVEGQRRNKGIQRKRRMRDKRDTVEIKVE